MDYFPVHNFPVKPNFGNMHPATLKVDRQNDEMFKPEALADFQRRGSATVYE